MAEPSPTGALFFATADDLTANVILKKLREDGAHNRTSAKKPSGFGEDGLVGIAIHPPKDGWWAGMDSADGAPGVGAGEWSTVAILANHLGSTAVWTRSWGDDLAIVIELVRGGSFFRALVGTRMEVDAFVASRGIDRAHARPPKDAAEDATLTTIRYEKTKYRSGPDADLVRALFELRRALEAGDTVAVRARFDALSHDDAPLGLALMRTLDDDASHATLAVLSRVLLAQVPTIRTKPLARMTFEEEVMRRVAERTDDEVVFLACLDRLDHVEGDAQRRSSHAHPAGVARLAAHFWQSSPKRALACMGRILARDDEPAWYHVNQALAALLAAHAGPLVLEGESEEIVRRTVARLPDLGESAQHAIRYNLACVYARAGRVADALATLAKAGDLRAQNPHPESDTDLRPLWALPEFVALLRGDVEEHTDTPLDTSLDTLELSVRATEALEELGVETVGELLAIEDATELPRAIVNELIAALAELEVEWSPAMDESEWEPPEDRRVPRLAITLEEDTRSDVSSRMGGMPSAPNNDVEWPCSENRPMDFVLQLVGKAGGGEIDLGDVHVLQVFADLEGDFYEDSHHAVVMHREACPAVLEAPVGVDVTAVRRMRFKPGFDDRILTDIEWPDDDDPLHDDHQAAHEHAWVDKVWGIPISANLDPDIEDSTGRKMRCLLTLSCIDDWFVWHLFVSEDFREARLEIVRG